MWGIARRVHALLPPAAWSTLCCSAASPASFRRMTSCAARHWGRPGRVILRRLTAASFVQSEATPTMKRCYEWLNKTSRSFSAVIQALHPELRCALFAPCPGRRVCSCRRHRRRSPAVCLFYLVLRALDTVEDDMSLDKSVKIPLLNNFYNVIETDGWSFDGSGPAEKDRGLLVRAAGGRRAGAGSSPLSPLF